MMRAENVALEYFTHFSKRTQYFGSCSFRFSICTPHDNAYIMSSFCVIMEVLSYLPSAKNENRLSEGRYQQKRGGGIDQHAW